MKCPHCQMDDVLISNSAELRLLSFVLTTITCPHCAGVFAIPKARLVAKDRKLKTPIHQVRPRYAA